MTTIEQFDVLLTDGGDVDEFICHVYDGLSPFLAKCGIHMDNDQHWQMHEGYGAHFIRRLPGTTKCPRCGASICPTCLSLCAS